jgi:deazaflavin-dependent oxidoreductase (nitroreductase family)
MGRETITLVTTGRRTGEPREATLYAFADGDDLLIVGSRGGSTSDPAWAINLRAEPRAVVRRGKRTHDVLAHESSGAERERLWELVSTAFPMYRSFQKRTSRQIPVFILKAHDADAR